MRMRIISFNKEVGCYKVLGENNEEKSVTALQIMQVLIAGYSIENAVLQSRGFKIIDNIGTETHVRVPVQNLEFERKLKYRLNQNSLNQNTLDSRTEVKSQSKKPIAKASAVASKPTSNGRVAIPKSAPRKIAKPVNTPNYYLGKPGVANKDTEESKLSVDEARRVDHILDSMSRERGF